MSSTRPPRFNSVAPATRDQRLRHEPLESLVVGHEPGPPSSRPPDEPQGIEALQQQIDRARPVVRRAWRHHRRAGLIAFAVVLVATVLVVVTFPLKYRSETVIFHQPGAAPNSVTATGAESRTDAVLLREMLMRYGRLESLIKDLQLYPDTVAKLGYGVAVEEFKGRIVFKALGKSTFRLGFVGDSPAESQRVASQLAATLIEEDAQHRNEQARRSKEFLDEELQRSASAVRSREDELSDFLASNPEFTAANQRRAVAAADTQTAPRAARVARRHRAPKIAASPSTAAAAPTARQPVRVAQPDPIKLAARNAAQNELQSAVRQLHGVESRFTERHPDVRSARTRVEGAERRLKSAMAALASRPAGDPDTETKQPDPYSETAPAAKPTSTSRAAAAKAEGKPRRRRAPRALAAIKPVAKAADKTKESELAAELETEWVRLTRAVDEARAHHDRLSSETFRADIAARSQLAGHVANVVVLDEAFLPAQPVRGRKIFALIGGVLAMLSAFALALGKALLDDRVFEAEDLTAAGFGPVLASVSTRERLRRSHV